MKSHLSLKSGCLAAMIIVAIIAIIAFSFPAMAASGEPSLTSGVSGNWILADFDGDRKLDLAEIHRSSLELHLSSGRLQSLPMASGGESPEMQLAVVDIDGDSDLDILVHDRFDPQRVHVWINDGHGTFAEAYRFRNPLSEAHSSWDRTPAPVPGLAIHVKVRRTSANQFAIAVLQPAASGIECGETSQPHTVRCGNDSIRLRAPPASFLS